MDNKIQWNPVEDNFENLDVLFDEIEEDYLEDCDNFGNSTHTLLTNNQLDKELPLIPIELKAGNSTYYKYIFLSIPFYLETFDYLNLKDTIQVDMSKNVVKPYLFPEGVEIKGVAVNRFLMEYVKKINWINRKVNIKDIKSNPPIIDKLLTRWFLLV